MASCIEEANSEVSMIENEEEMDASSANSDFVNEENSFLEPTDNDVDEEYAQTENDEDFEELTPRKKRRKIQKDRYLDGKSRKPYRLSNRLSQSFNETSSSTEESMVSDWNSNVCKYCAPVLQKYYETFNSLKRQGSELKKRKHINPHPKKPNREHYRDLTKQNSWILSNIFDSMGNYLLCCFCVHHGLGISYQRLTRQRNIKRSQNKQPIVKLTKLEIIKQSLAQYVIMPDIDMSFIRWWKTIDNNTELSVRILMNDTV